MHKKMIGIKSNSKVERATTSEFSVVEKGEVQFTVKAGSVVEILDANVDDNYLSGVSIKVKTENNSVITIDSNFLSCRR